MCRCTVAVHKQMCASVFVCRPQVWQCSVFNALIRGEQHIAQFVLDSELHRPVLKLQGKAIDVELHIKLHIVDKLLEKPTNTEPKGNHFFQVGCV